MGATRIASVYENSKTISYLWMDCRDKYHHQGLKRCRDGDSYHISIQLAYVALQKTDVSCITTLVYCKLNQVVTPTAAVVPDVLSLLEQINTSSCNWLAAILRFFFPSIPVSKDQGSANFFVSDRMENILGFMGRRSLSQLLNSDIVVQKHR